MKRRDFLIGAVSAAAAPVALGFAPRDDAGEPENLEETDVFVAGAAYPAFRIPALFSTGRGTLLAAAEGRQALGDHSQNDLVLRVSADAGGTWEPLRVVGADRPHVLANPTLVEAREIGRVFLVYQRYPAGFHERAVVPGYDDPRVCRTFVIHSDDGGRTWSPPREITRQVKRPEGATSTASGPGVGIQLRRGPYRGRLVVPFNEGPAGAWKVYAAYSDDRGESWRYGERAPDMAAGTGNEVQAVELADGRVMLNARSMGGSRCRKVAFSRDGAKSWSPLADDGQLPEPECQATITRYSWPGLFSKGRLLFANPAARDRRTSGTVRLSYDDGRTWPVSRVVHAGGFAYSCLAVLPDRRIGLLYERDEYRAITFARFPLSWLTSRARAGQNGAPAVGHPGT